MHERDGYYFAVTRLLTGSGRSESSACESRSGATIAFTVTYAFLAAPLFVQLSIERVLLGVIVVPCTVWLLWAVILYLNALLRHAATALGLAASVPARDFQHALFCVWLSLFALSLLRQEGVFRWFGVGWFVIMSLEIIATLILKFSIERARATP